MNPCVLFSGIPQRMNTQLVCGTHSASIRNLFRRYTESIPQVYGIHSAGLRNEVLVPVYFLKDGISLFPLR
ncbi:Uncharacterised protein [Chlamydia trachomatis]|nr:Uncharacterised protein [Chlamydia trachomatis]